MQVSTFHNRARELLCSVIVPTCHRPDFLAVCLERLAPGRQTLAACHYEVVVTDDSRNSASRQMVHERFPWARWAAGPRRGPAANRNQGAREARGTWLAFVDDDCQPEPTWLGELTPAVDESELDVVEGRTVCPGKQDSPFQEQVENLTGGLYWSCNLAMRRETFLRLGGFDEDFEEAGGEDMEFAWRIRQAGLETRFAPAACVLHPPRRISWRKLWWRTLMIRWMLLYWLKTGQAPPLRASPTRVYSQLLHRQLLDLARTTVHLVTRFERGAWRRRFFFQIWKWATFPVVLPYLFLWEARFRKLLALRTATSANPFPSLARG